MFYYIKYLFLLLSFFDWCREVCIYLVNLECETLEGLEIIKSDTLTDDGIIPVAKCKNLKIVCLEQIPNVSIPYILKPHKNDLIGEDIRKC